MQNASDKDRLSEKRQRWICHVVRIRAPDGPAVRVPEKHNHLAYRAIGIFRRGTCSASVPRVCVFSAVTILKPSHLTRRDIKHANGPPAHAPSHGGCQSKETILAVHWDRAEEPTQGFRAALIVQM